MNSDKTTQKLIRGGGVKDVKGLVGQGVVWYLGGHEGLEGVRSMDGASLQKVSI